MRQSKKEIKNKDIVVSLLNACHAGRLGTIGRDGYPMVKPLNFAFHEGNIYFHTATAGEKIDDINRDNRVCFEVDLPIAYVKGNKNPCRAEYLYRSVIIKGRAYILDDQREKIFALKCLMEKYQPEGGYGNFLEDKLEITGLVRIEIEDMTGKEDLGRDALKDVVLKALEEKAHLPLMLNRPEPG